MAPLPYEGVEKEAGKKMSRAASHTIGIDEGTTGVRAIVVDESGALVGHAYRPVRADYPQPGWIEHPAEELWQTTNAVLAGALDNAGLRADEIAAIGIANQRGAAAIFDPTGKPLGPILGWQDQRTAARCVELLGEGFFVIPNTAASKYEWLLREHGAGVSDVRLGTIDTYLACRLSEGGVFASDHSNYSVSGVYEFFAGTLDQRTIDHLKIDASILPKLADSSGILGETSARVFGAEVPIAALAGDQHAAMYAQGCREVGTIEIEIGTSAMVKRNEGASLGEAPEGSYPLVLWALDGSRTFCFESPVITAGAAAGWLLEGLGLVADIKSLEPLARSVEDSGGVWAVPALAGLGGPHLDLDARGMIGGISRATSRAHIARAMIEGIAWRCAEAAVALGGESGPARIRVAGGAADNDLLLQLMADASGAEVERPELLDRAALGAAYLAQRALGMTTDDEVASRWQAYRNFTPSWSEDERATRREKWLSRIALARTAGT